MSGAVMRKEDGSAARDFEDHSGTRLVMPMQTCARTVHVDRMRVVTCVGLVLLGPRHLVALTGACRMRVAVLRGQEDLGLDSGVM